MALLAATVFEARAGSLRVIGAVVDHGLQEGSAEHTAAVVSQMAGLGADETVSVRVQVEVAASGMEAGAREARYAALEQVADHFAAAVVLLGHTLDDQAETVLLGLARGSGTRSLAGMRRGFDRFRRPFLDLTRADTETACRDQGIDWWTDPHNSDPRFLRASIRHSVMPVLEQQLGPGVAAALARTADSVREDVDALDDLAEALFSSYDFSAGLAVTDLLAHPPALRLRLIRLALLAAGAPGSDLNRAHVLAVDALVTESPHDTNGGAEKSLDLPGRVTVRRSAGTLLISGA